MIVSCDTIRLMNWKLTPITYSTQILRKLAEIEQLIGRVEGLQLSKPTPKLRNKNRARSVRGSTGIEGNSCSVEQVEAIQQGEPVALSMKELIEIKNALDAYAALPELDPFSIDSLLCAQAGLMSGGLMLGAGKFRTGPVEVYITETETQAMPHWETIPASMDELFDYLRESDELMLIKSIRFHYEFVNLHPFFDGNGRVVRLWQTRLLMEEHPVFEFLDVESMVFEHRNEYYRQIRRTQECGNIEGFILFIFEQIERSLTQLWKKSETASRTSEDRLRIARDTFNANAFSRKDYLQLFKTISPGTASRDLASGTAASLLTRTGDKRTALYRFKIVL
jgi:Fic family protein